MHQKEVVVTSSVGTMSKVDISRCKVVQEPLLINQIVFFFRKNHYLVNLVDDKIGIFKAVGLNDYWISQYVKKKKFISFDSGPKILTIYTLSGIFKIFIYGLVVATFVFFLEIFYHRISIIYRTFFFHFDYIE